MSRALYTAATGMHAQQLKIDVIANNLSNVNTDGYKRMRAEFQDLMYQNLRIATPGDPTGVELPVGLQVGLGVRPSATVRNFEQGEVKNTSNNMDIAIQGRGFLQVRLPSGEVAYTRNGSLKVDSQGRMTTGEGYLLEPQISLPRDASPEKIEIKADGRVLAALEGDREPVEIGQIELADVINEGALQGIGQNLYRLSGGGARVGLPGEGSLGTVLQGYLENSNVRVVEEMIAMITGQRAYEASSKVIQTSDRMLEEVNRLR